jgi:hypothetical protein
MQSPVRGNAQHLYLPCGLNLPIAVLFYPKRDKISVVAPGAGKALAVLKALF